MAGLWLRRLVAAALGLALTTGCSATPEAGGGFVAGDGTIPVIAAASRQPAPIITGQTLDGSTWSSETVRDKVIVYNVWGSWCSPCRAEAPALQAAAQATSEQAVFVGVNTRDLDKAAPQAFVRAFGITYPNLFDPDGSLLLAFSGQLPASAIPSTLLIDRQGRIAARVIGETTQATLVGLVDDIAQGK